MQRVDFGICQLMYENIDEERNGSLQECSTCEYRVASSDALCCTGQHTTRYNCINRISVRIKEYSDQSGRPPRLIRVFAVRSVGN